MHRKLLKVFVSNYFSVVINMAVGTNRRRAANIGRYAGWGSGLLTTAAGLALTYPVYRIMDAAGDAIGETASRITPEPVEIVAKTLDYGLPIAAAVLGIAGSVAAGVYVASRVRRYVREGIQRIL